MLVNHKFREHSVDPFTETLIVGTFNPDTERNRKTDFFYASAKNNFWSLVPSILGSESLKCSDVIEKRSFMRRFRIDFIDFIAAVEVEAERAHIRDDSDIDSKVVEWIDVIARIETLSHLKRVGFTRSSFANIPNIKKRVDQMREYLAKSHSQVRFDCLITPVGSGRAAGPEKQRQSWEMFLLSKSPT
jgi:G:T/U-mismatch repair DNA glycosylase